MKSEVYTQMSATEEQHWWFVVRRRIIENQIKRMKLKKNCRILEIGVGTGGNLEMLSKFGNVKGFDMSQEALDFANTKTNGKYEISEGSCPDNIPKYDEKFDLVCMFDVLEHIDRDVETLEQVKNLIAEDGRLLLTVPAYGWLWSEHDNVLHHHRRYTLKELLAKSKKTGWKVEYDTYFNTLLLPLVILVRFKDRYFSNEAYTGADLPGKITNATLKFVFGIENFLLKIFRFPFGVSICASLKVDNE